MNVAHLFYDGSIVEVDTSEAQKSAKSYLSNESFVTLLRIAGLCNNAEFKSGQELVPISKRQCNGLAFEAALLKFVELSIGDVTGLRARNKKAVEIPYKSVNKFRVSIHENENSGDPPYLLLMRGFPERTFYRCDTVLIDGKEYLKNDDHRRAFEEAYIKLGSAGEQVWGFADLKLPTNQFPKGFVFNTDEENFPQEGLRFIGLISMTVPPRAAVPDAEAKFVP